MGRIENLFVLPKAELVAGGLQFGGDLIEWNRIVDLRWQNQHQRRLMIWVDSEDGPIGCQLMLVGHDASQVESVWQASIEARLERQGWIDVVEMARVRTRDRPGLLLVAIAMLAFSFAWVGKILFSWRSLGEFFEPHGPAVGLGLIAVASGPLLIGGILAWMWWAARKSGLRLRIPGRRERPITGSGAIWRCVPGFIESESGARIPVARLSGGKVLRRLHLERRQRSQDLSVPDWQWARIARLALLWPLIATIWMLAMAPAAMEWTGVLIVFALGAVGGVAVVLENFAARRSFIEDLESIR